MPIKRQAPDSDRGPPLNSIKSSKTRADGSPADYSNDVKKKLSASNRTGQACDRCRIRKMRCDDRPEGCSPCMQNQSSCRTTDRITGVATVRGYVQNLEQRIQYLENHNRELQDKLHSFGIEIKPSNTYDDTATTSLAQWNQAQGNGDHQVWESDGHNGNSTNNHTIQYASLANGSSMSSPTDTNVIRLPEFRGGLTGDNYLGVSSGNSLLSSIRGTSLNVLGMEIDLADYMSSDLDEPDPSALQDKPLCNKSYHAFVQTAFSSCPKPKKPPLPPKKEGLMYAEWYFRVINPYLPFLHKPTFMSMLIRLYDEREMYEPSVANTVLVHMMFAIMFYQYATRNWENADQQSHLNATSNLHYHYALGFFPQLMASHTLWDVQALTMLSLHLRSFPKPGACWMMTTTTFNVAIELGLHRSARRWALTTPKRSLLEIEMRKRIFWSILVIHIIISGMLGRPMALSADDFDVELPEPIDDDLLDDRGLDESKPGKCSFLVGIEVFKIEPIFMDLYNNIYAVKRSPHTYIDTIRRLEYRMSQCCEQWPRELIARSATNAEEGRVYAQYMNVWELEFRLLLRHPSLSLTTSTEFNHENLSICMEVSKKMLHHVKQIQSYKSLDTNWQTGALYVLALSTTLYGHMERRDQITTADFMALREDMDAWLSIMGDVGQLLGSGKRLQDAVRVTVDNTLDVLSQHLASKTASSALSTATQNVIPPRTTSAHTLAPAQENYSHSNAYASYTDASNHTTTSNDTLDNNDHPRNIYASPSDATLTDHSSHPYTTQAHHFSYPEPPSTSLSSYAVQTNTPSFDPTTTYHGGASLDPSSHSQQHVTTPQQATAAAATAYLYSQPSSTHSHNPQANNNYQSATSANLYDTTGSQSSWRQWAGNIATTLEPQEYINSASALMQLGGARNDQSGTGSGGNVNVIPTTDVMAQGLDARVLNGEAGGQPWPLMLFHAGQGGPGN